MNVILAGYKDTYVKSETREPSPCLTLVSLIRTYSLGKSGMYFVRFEKAVLKCGWKKN